MDKAADALTLEVFQEMCRHLHDQTLAVLPDGYAGSVFKAWARVSKLAELLGQEFEEAVAHCYDRVTGAFTVYPRDELKWVYEWRPRGAEEI